MTPRNPPIRSAPLPAAERAELLTRLADECRSGTQQEVAARIGFSIAAINRVLKGTYVAKPDNLLRALRDSAPSSAAAPGEAGNWIGALRAECARTTQAAAARRIGVGDTTVSQVLSGNYAASTQRIERRVRGALMGAQCTCPVMGEVSTKVCQDVQERRPGKGGTGIGNPQHATAWYACRGQGRFTAAGPCPHFNAGGRQATTTPAQEA
ncbi:helix-turn-helix domain-containing protein [Pseudaquabacterium pictum]|uniref:Uncharacterized protein n=1 Tax=Pseudaquabacterium pictum TaxID=2315236 RepID=A0A480ASE0_9BURK|nr:helix-turn-helix transcriptional regulator [Rubrivivax pictus]GCL64333.1 hypothetical protein AQPW35_34140 [Rubrivivax pictus]